MDGRVGGWMHGRMDKRMDGQMDRWMYGRVEMGKWVDRCVSGFVVEIWEPGGAFERQAIHRE